MAEEMTQVQNQDGTQLEERADGSLVPAHLLMKSKYGDEATHERMASSGFLPRVQLMTGSSKLVQKNKCKIASFCIIRGKETLVRDLGDSFSCVVLAWRPKAMHFAQDGVKAYYNPRTEKFQAVEREAEKKPRQKGFMYGPEYMVYVPDVGEICLFHFNNVTMRMRAGEMRALMGRAATLRSEMIEDKGNMWPAPIITGCSTPLGLPCVNSEEEKALHERFRVQVEKFCNPPDEVTEEGGAEEVSDGEAAGASERTR